MRELPILFSGPMVRALLEDRKTQTRRVIKTTNPSETVIDMVEKGGGWWDARVVDGSFRIIKPAYQVGDLLWVRETWCPCVHGSYEPWYRHLKSPERQTDAFIQYRSDGHGDEYDGYWRPSIFMPRWASRLTLEVTGVQAERLQDISEEDAKAEGIESRPVGGLCMYRDYSGPDPVFGASPVLSFRSLWSTIHKADGPNGWAANPWVWAYAFRQVSP